MDATIDLEYNGQTHSADYHVHGDVLTVFLPDGDQRSTVLNGLDPEMAAMVHLRSYVNQLDKRAI